MFKRLLIANRGEIACRIMRTARRMGIATIAVYSDADRNALHVAMADEAIRIGPAPALQSYLDIERILAACRETRADAVHPGYGFLSERAEFAGALDTAGITFVGPNVHAISAMGDKIESKRRAAAAGVKTVPGVDGNLKDAAAARSAARRIGYPVMLKASAGGGGKGMRIAWSENDIEEGFTRARSEAQSSFGDDRILIEKYIVEPRHIEIQVLGDKHGNIIHLGERECTIQRRNQKVVEEAPSPLLDDLTRAAMGAEAVALAKAVGYDSAGTVEFVVGQDKSYYFLEMNTRLQVEHPVTELVTGVDLVEQMLRIAAGEPLSLKQSDIAFSGWAIESRIYAEDPQRSFLPSTGRLIRYQPPAEISTGPVRVRNDSGVTEGSEISIHYDPMISKLVTHAPTRDGAIDAQSDALDSYILEGIRHNGVFLSALMQHPRWQSGKLSTGFIAEEYPEGFKPREPTADEARELAAVAVFLDNVNNLRRRGISQQMNGRPVRFAVQRVVDLSGVRFPVEVSGQLHEPCEVTFLDAEGHHDVGIRLNSQWWPGEHLWTGEIDTEPASFQVRAILNGYELSRRGILVAARVYTRREAELAARLPERIAADTSKFVLCPMPGLVRTIHVEVGQQIRAGDVLAIVEAMKMENVLRAERDGHIKKISASVGDNLPVDHIIFEFE